MTIYDGSKVNLAKGILNTTVFRARNNMCILTLTETETMVLSDILREYISLKEAAAEHENEY